MIVVVDTEKIPKEFTPLPCNPAGLAGIDKVFLSDLEVCPDFEAYKERLKL